ncbi:MAG: biopolymer transporter ExbD [Candidatus Latescibacteria bacterium]|nr:biopolymer transporter ExbD [Candidatus Latescibacterota bacterium]
MVKKKPRIGIKIDMTPMVDVAFLLLIFFMSTTQFKAPETIPIALPSSHHNVKLPESDVLILSVSDENAILWKIGQQPEAEIGLAELEKAIVDARIRNPKLRIAIKADKDADFGTVNDIMDILQQTGNTRFNLVTILEEDSRGPKKTSAAPTTQTMSSLARR